MTKEEKIKEAYGKNWEIVKDKVNKDGWIKDREFIFSDFIEPIDWQTTDHDDEYYDTRRPMKLKGIENNNGWVKIESEIDLPKENIECFFRVVVNERYCNAGVYINNGRFRVKSSLTNSENFFTVDDVIRNYFPKVTHYKVIEKPQPPIY